jgi:tryptophan halogenase
VINVRPIKDVVILGGGTSGWMTAAYLARTLGAGYNITLIESDGIGTIGVGEATIPSIKFYIDTLGIEEKSFIKETQATFKLGIEFVNWGKPKDRYIHGFSKIGHNAYVIDFYNYWLQQKLQNNAAHLDYYSIATAACLANKFVHPRYDSYNTPLAQLYYAYHFDAAKFAAYLRSYSEAKGVTRIEGMLSNVKTSEVDGSVKSLVLESGQQISGDLFVDCSGFKSLLLNKTLGAEWEDWSAWLPCDRAIAVPSDRLSTLPPYTRATAKTAGWQWRIPLQHRTGNGHVFASAFIGEDEATDALLSGIEGNVTGDPRTIAFKTGKYKNLWRKNVVAIGLAGGFIEPLESTAIYLVQLGIEQLVQGFPRSTDCQINADVYNAALTSRYELVRDFVVLHYKATQRDDSEFWRYTASMDVPDTLQQKINLFTEAGQILNRDYELFQPFSWAQVMTGQNLIPRHAHPVTEAADKTVPYVENVRKVIANCVDQMPTHEQFLSGLLGSPTHDMSAHIK